MGYRGIGYRERREVGKMNVECRTGNVECRRGTNFGVRHSAFGVGHFSCEEEKEVEGA